MPGSEEPERKTILGSNNGSQDHTESLWTSLPGGSSSRRQDTNLSLVSRSSIHAATDGVPMDLSAIELKLKVPHAVSPENATYSLPRVPEYLPDNLPASATQLSFPERVVRRVVGILKDPCPGLECIYAFYSAEVPEMVLEADCKVEFLEFHVSDIKNRPLLAKEFKKDPLVDSIQRVQMVIKQDIRNIWRDIKKFNKESRETYSIAQQNSLSKLDGIKTIRSKRRSASPSPLPQRSSKRRYGYTASSNSDAIFTVPSPASPAATKRSSATTVTTEHQTPRIVTQSSAVQPVAQALLRSVASTSQLGDITSVANDSSARSSIQPFINTAIQSGPDSVLVCDGLSKAAKVHREAMEHAMDEIETKHHEIRRLYNLINESQVSIKEIRRQCSALEARIEDHQAAKETLDSILDTDTVARSHNQGE